MSDQNSRVLFVETEPGNGESVAKYLEPFAGSELHLEIATEVADIRSHAVEQWDYVLLDGPMAGGKKAQLVEAIRRNLDGVPIIDLGNTDQSSLASRSMDPGTRAAPKVPVKLSALLRSVGHELEREELIRKIDLLQIKSSEQDRTDPITGLWTRPYLMSRLEELFEEYRRYNSALTLCLIDVVSLSTISNEFGDEATEQVISGLGKLIIELKRSTDFGARFGLDKFCIVMPTSELKSALIGVERIRDAFKHKIFSGNSHENFTVEVCIGVVQLNDQHLDVSEFVQAAREALMKAKAQGPWSIQVDWSGVPRSDSGE